MYDSIEKMSEFIENISFERALKGKFQFVDVRTPEEFALDHIPHSINISLFDNNERKEIGLLYKHSREEAFKRGYQRYIRNLGRLVRSIRTIKNNNVVVYCWRGGLRSASMTILFKLLGYNVFRLKGGYKAYREYIRNFLANLHLNPKNIYVLTGLTGVGKTELIKRLPNALDLEGLAKHRSSAFGALGLRPRTQKMFESLLYFELMKLNPNKPIFVEHESRKIGDLFIPERFFGYMQKGKFIEIICDISCRVRRTMKEYLPFAKEELIKSILLSIKKKLGRIKLADLIELLENKNYKEFTSEILINYYDPLYKYSIKDKNIIARIRNHNINHAKKEILKISKVH